MMIYVFFHLSKQTLQETNLQYVEGIFLFMWKKGKASLWQVLPAGAVF